LKRRKRSKVKQQWMRSDKSEKIGEESDGAQSRGERQDGRVERPTALPVCNYRIGHPDFGRKTGTRNKEEENKMNKNEKKMRRE
jgi:hypothetical protein